MAKLEDENLNQSADTETNEVEQSDDVENVEVSNSTDEVIKEETVENSNAVVEESTNENNESLEETDKKTKKDGKRKNSLLARIFQPIQRNTKHFDRKEKTRPLAIIVAVLSSIICLGFMAIAVWGVVKIFPTALNALSSMALIFFSEKALLFSVGFAIIPGIIILVVLGGFFLALMGLFFTFGFIFLNFPIVSIQTAKLPKHVFAYERDSFKNMILAYIFGAVVSFLGFAMFMDKSIGYPAYIVLGAGIIIFLIAILLTVDIAQAKKAFRNLQDETEKQEIIEESRVIEEQKKLRKKNRKIAGNILKKIFRKK